MKVHQLSKLLLFVLPAFTISLFPFATKSHPKQPVGINATEGEILDPILVYNKSEGPSQTKVFAAASVRNDRMEVTEQEIDNHVGPYDSYSMYKHLMEMKDSLTGKTKEIKKEPELVKTVKEALVTMFEVGVKAVLEGFFPHVHRQKRSAEGSKRTILEWLINFIGALLGKQECTKILACRTGKMVGSKVPGAGMAMLMLDGVVPKSLKSWFGVVKEAVIDKKDTCEEEYHCTLTDEEVEE